MGFVLMVRRINSGIKIDQALYWFEHPQLFFRLPLDLNMEPSLEDELWLANLSVC